MANNLTPTAVNQSEPKRMQIRRKLKAALDGMIWSGLAFDEAARAANFNVRAMRKALERPHVRNYLRTQKQVFRESVSAANIHRAREIRDQTDNQMAAIKAIQVIEQLGDVDHARGGISGEPLLPGLTIVITNTRDATTVGPVIDHEPRDDE
jgi:hypothetical protein